MFVNLFDYEIGFISHIAHLVTAGNDGLHQQIPFSLGWHRYLENTIFDNRIYY
jgi:hypothetical protein